MFSYEYYSEYNQRLFEELELNTMAMERLKTNRETILQKLNKNLEALDFLIPEKKKEERTNNTELSDEE